MGKHDKNTGKGRLDKFYKLAKEQGYRARSAFKLIHLNRKYDLLSRSRCVIDLCAAPGGWLQVAEKYMPKGSLIVGVDLNPIKPLPHVITFVSDITSPLCRTQLRGHLHDWKADLVLHDGAPNVGSAWVQDAFTQNELVLQSLKLATDFLAKGGNFVTKVFRSQDYNSLMWVFGQLFKTVEATKPPSSRNVSAEIFVVCRDFVAPKHIDPKFLDPKHVFKDIAPLPASITLPPIDPSSSTSAATQASTSASAAAAARLASNSHAHANVFMPEKKRRNREGYAEGDNLLFHTALAEDFVRGTDPVALLGSMNKIVIVSEQEQTWLKSRHTTPDVIANFEDLKVLGKGDFKSLMKWRLAIRLETGLDVKPVVTADVTEEVTVEPMDEDEQMSEELKKLHQERQSRQRKERRRKNEKKARELLKMQLNMAVPADLDNEDRALGGEEEMFDLGEGEKEASRGGIRKGLRDVVQDEDGLSGDDDEASAATEEEDEEILDSEEEREAKLHGLEGELDELYNQYRERMSERDAKWKVKHARNKDRNQGAWYGFEGGSDGQDGVDKRYRERMVRVPRQDGDDGGGGEESEEGGWDVVAAGKAKLGEEIDSSDEESEEEEEDDNNVAGKASRKTVRFPQSTAAKPVGAARNLVTSLQDGEKLPQMSRQAQLWFAQPVFKDLDDLLALDGDDEDDGENVEASEEVPSEEESLDEPKGDGDVEMEEASVTSSTLEDDNDDDDFGIVPQQPIEDGPGWDVDDEDQDEMKRKTIKDKGLLTAEAVTLATALVNRQTTASKLIDDGFNRLSTFHKDGLPTWFLDDESKYYKPNIPLTKEAIDALREKQRALDARPIKKIAEAKARKKFKAVQRVEKAKKKADGVMEADDLNMNEKARAIGKVMGRAHGREKKVDKKIVVAKGANRGVKGRPKGVKGKYKIVDARMRKEVRAQKRIKKANKKR